MLWASLKQCHLVQQITGFHLTDGRWYHFFSYLNRWTEDWFDSRERWFIPSKLGIEQNFIMLPPSLQFRRIVILPSLLRMNIQKSSDYCLRHFFYWCLPGVARGGKSWTSDTSKSEENASEKNMQTMLVKIYRLCYRIYITCSAFSQSWFIYSKFLCAFYITLLIRNPCTGFLSSFRIFGESGTRTCHSYDL